MSLEVTFDEDKIFKYGEVKNLERTLKNRTLGFSNLAKLNDPFEASYNYVHHFSSAERSTNYSENSIKGSEAEFVKSVKSIVDTELSKYVVTCFTRTPNEPLMWAHYAENHTGVCYCFDNTKLFQNKDYKNNDIQYSNRRAKLYFFENSTTNAQLKSQLGDLICAKSDAWSYEKELRYYIPSEELVHEYEPQALVAIILGCRVSDAEFRKAQELVNSYNQKNGQKIELYYSSMSGWLYEMVVHKMNITTETTGHAVIPVEGAIEFSD